MQVNFGAGNQGQVKVWVENLGNIENLFLSTHKAVSINQRINPEKGRGWLIAVILIGRFVTGINRSHDVLGGKRENEIIGPGRRGTVSHEN